MENSRAQVVAEESQGVIEVHDPRVFHAGRRDFGRQWLNAVLQRPGVRKARVDLATATARVEFHLGAGSTESMSSVFADAVLDALTAPFEASPDRHDWVALTGFAGSEPGFAWEIDERSKHRLRIRYAGLSGDGDRRSRWLERLSAVEGVSGCRALWFSEGFVLTFNPSQTSESRILDAAQEAWQAVDSSRLVAVSGNAVLGSRLDRLANLAKAAGAFTLTLAALVIPGLPTVPFLLATSYYLARSSTRLHQALLNSSFFGPIVGDWETYRGLSPSSKRKLIGLTVVVIVVTVALTPFSLIVFALILMAGSVSLYEVAQLPGVPSAHEPVSSRETLAFAAG